MIEMHVGAVALDRQSGEPIVVLSDAENKRTLPIWVGAPEARAITFAVKKIPTARPLTHDLLFSLIKRFGYAVKEIRIESLNSKTYRAMIVLVKENGAGHETKVMMDSRPSDAIALAVISEARVLVARDIVLQSSISTSPETDEQDEADFKKFLEGVKASDFKIDRGIESLEVNELLNGADEELEEVDDIQSELEDNAEDE